MGQQFKWDLDSRLVASRVSERPVQESQGDLLRWGAGTQRVRDWERVAHTGPKGGPVHDRRWILDVAERYGLGSLAVPDGAVTWERLPENDGGRRWTYPDGTWAFGLSLRLFQLRGFPGVEPSLARTVTCLPVGEPPRPGTRRRVFGLGDIQEHPPLVRTLRVTKTP